MAHKTWHMNEWTIWLEHFEDTDKDVVEAAVYTAVSEIGKEIEKWDASLNYIKRGNDDRKEYNKGIKAIFEKFNMNLKLKL